MEYSKHRKLTPFEIEKVKRGHPDLNHAQVARLYGITRVYARMLRVGLRGVVMGRSEGKPKGQGRKAMRTLHEHQFWADFLRHAVPLLRTTLRAEQELRKTGVFHTEVAADGRERKWRRAELEPVEGRKAPENTGAAAGLVRAAKPAYVPQAGERKPGPADEGFLFDTR